MKKLFKILGLIFGLIILLSVISLFYLVYFVNPNDFKPFLSNKIYQLTGRQVVFKGDLQWTWFPSIGLNIYDVEMPNPPGFGNENFMSVHQMKVSVSVLGLLHKQVNTEDIILDGLRLNLIQNQKGQTNWATPLVPMPGKKEVVMPVEDQSTQDQAKMVTFHLNIPSVTIRDASINWQDFKNKQSVQINHLNVFAKNIDENQSIAVTTSFDVVSDQPAMRGSINLSAQVLMDRAQKTIKLTPITIQTDLRGKMFPAGSLQAKFNANMDASPNEVRFDDLSLKVNQTLLTGQVDVGRLDLLSEKPIDTSTMLRTMSLRGQLLADNLSIIGVNQVQQLRVTMNGDNGQLTLAPITAMTYQGTLDGKATINFQSSPPVISMTAMMTRIALQPLLKDVVDREALSGTANVRVALSMKGFNAPLMIRTLNGRVELSVDNGQLNGIDFLKIVSLAQSLEQSANPLNSQYMGSTVFDSLTGTATITNGVMSNNDLMITSKITDIKGAGTIDLVKQQINYTFEANQNTRNRVGSIPINVTGPFSNVKVRLDPSKLLESTLQKNAQHVLQGALDQLQTTGKISGLQDLLKGA